MGSADLFILKYRKISLEKEIFAYLFITVGLGLEVHYVNSLK